MALIGLNRDELDLSQLPKDVLYDPKKDDKDTIRYSDKGDHNVQDN